MHLVLCNSVNIIDSTPICGDIWICDFWYIERTVVFFVFVFGSIMHMVNLLIFPRFFSHCFRIPCSAQVLILQLLFCNLILSLSQHKARRYLWTNFKKDVSWWTELKLGNVARLKQMQLCKQENESFVLRWREYNIMNRSTFFVVDIRFYHF